MYGYLAIQLPQILPQVLPQMMIRTSLQRQGRSRFYLSLILSNVNKISVWLPSLFSLTWCSNQSGQTNGADSPSEDLRTDSEVAEPLAYTTEDPQLDVPALDVPALDVPALDVPAVELGSFWMQEPLIERVDLTSASADAFDMAESRCLRHCWTSDRNSGNRCLVGCWQDYEPGGGYYNLDAENGGDR